MVYISFGSDHQIFTYDVVATEIVAGGLLFLFKGLIEMAQVAVVMPVVGLQLVEVHGELWVQ